MSPLTRRGVTLIETVVALAVLALTGVPIVTVLLWSRRTYVAEAGRVEVERNLRIAAAILVPELRALDAADSDIAAMSATSITIRAMRQLAFLCVAPSGQLSFVVRQRPVFGTPASFRAGDSVLLYLEGDAGSRSDDAWLRGQVTATGAEDCPDKDHARPGVRLTLDGTESPPPPRGAVTNGSPLRGFMTVTYASYQSPSDGEWYLGQRIAGATFQPLAGPLTGPGGLAFTYYDSSGAMTAAPTAVWQIGIRVCERSPRPPHAVGSLVTWVTLRNNPRCLPCP